MAAVMETKNQEHKKTTTTGMLDFFLWCMVVARNFGTAQ